MNPNILINLLYKSNLEITNVVSTWRSVCQCQCQATVFSGFTLSARWIKVYFTVIYSDVIASHSFQHDVYLLDWIKNCVYKIYYLKFYKERVKLVYVVNNIVENVFYYLFNSSHCISCKYTINISLQYLFYSEL